MPRATPTYTMKNAAMSLADARHVMRTRETMTWSPAQLARARVVVAHWERIRKSQAARKATAKS
jgi:hypothetical protein